MAIYDQYTKEILEQLNYNATWLPTVQLTPGDVCDLRGNEIRLVAHLTEFDIPSESENLPVKTDFEYASAGGVSIQFKASGDPPPTGSLLEVSEAGIALSFSKSSAVLLRMAKCTSKRLKSLQKIGDQVLALHNADKWPDGYVVVSEIVSAGASTIIISSGEDAGIDLSAKAGAGVGPLTLASLDAGLQVKRESKIGAKFVAVPGLTPLVRVSGIKKRFFRPDTFKGAGPKPEPNTFGAVDYADYAK